MTQDELLQGVVIPVDKPRQWTSFQAVNKIKAAIRRTFDLKKFKIGHAGTLDPLASGLLLVCVGKATKRIDELQSGTKVYSGTFVFGATTPCYDLERPIAAYYPFAHISPALLQSALPQFLGTVQQVPPIFSAVKIDGQNDIYVMAAVGPDGHAGILVTRYLDNDNVTAIELVKVRVDGRSLAGATCHLTDKVRFYTQIFPTADEDGAITLQMKHNSFAFIEL
jgi:tRNA pseudouridine55 synthase